MSKIKQLMECQRLAEVADFTKTDRRCWETYVPQHLRDDWAYIPPAARACVVELCNQLAMEYEQQI